MLVIPDSKIKHLFYGGLSVLSLLINVLSNSLCVKELQTDTEWTRLPTVFYSETHGVLMEKKKNLMEKNFRSCFVALFVLCPLSLQ